MIFPSLSLPHTEFVLPGQTIVLQPSWTRRSEKQPQPQMTNNQWEELRCTILFRLQRLTAKQNAATSIVWFCGKHFSVILQKYYKVLLWSTEMEEVELWVCVTPPYPPSNSPLLLFSSSSAFQKKGKCQVRTVGHAHEKSLGAARLQLDIHWQEKNLGLRRQKRGETLYPVPSGGLLYREEKCWRLNYLKTEEHIPHVISPVISRVPGWKDLSLSHSLIKYYWRTISGGVRCPDGIFKPGELIAWIQTYVWSSQAELSQQWTKTQMKGSEAQ